MERMGGGRRTVRRACGGAQRALTAGSCLDFRDLYGFFFQAEDGIRGKLVTGVQTCALPILFAAVFWSAFEQAPTSLNLFAQDFTDRYVFGWEVPVIWFQAANGIFIVLFAPFFASLWLTLGKRGRNPPSTAKFAVGLLSIGVGFAIMILAANIVVNSGGSIKVSPLWLIVSYLFQTFGELSLSPVGLSSMTKLSPRKYVGQMMGIWFLASSVGNLIGGLVGGHVDPNKLDQMPKLFIATTVTLVSAAVILGLMVPFIKKLIPNEDKLVGE